jgi:hypothetical protein
VGVWVRVMDRSEELFCAGADAFVRRIGRQKELYRKTLSLMTREDDADPVFRIRDSALFGPLLEAFGPALEQQHAKADLESIYEIGLHKRSGALIVCNKGATLYCLSQRTSTPFLARHIGFCVYMPGLGMEFANVSLVGDRKSVV